MTNQKLLIPLRVPELGPFMGKVVVGSGTRPTGLRLAEIRQQLATRIFQAAGEARRLAAREERQAALSAIGRTAWMEAWDEAVRDVAGHLTEQVARSLEAEARAVRMPRRKRRRLLPDVQERRAIAARLGSAGATLVPALDTIELRATEAVVATALEQGSVEAWQDALRTAARRLESAWLDLERALEKEIQQWERVAEEVSRWRRPWWPVIVFSTVGLAVAVWLGLVFGGQLQPPEWLARLWETVGGW